MATLCNKINFFLLSIETTSIGKGLSLLNNESLYLRNCSLVNFRFGIEIQDLAHKSENRSAKIIDISTEKCSIGATITSNNKDFQVSQNI